MKSIICVCLFFVVAVAFARPEEDHYTNKYDDVNLDEILSNKRLLEPYVKCTLEEGKCSPDGKELKAHIKEALENECGKCTDKQKAGTEQVIKHLINHEPEYWSKLTAKYDQDKKFTVKYEKRLKEIQA